MDMSGQQLCESNLKGVSFPIRHLLLASSGKMVSFKERLLIQPRLQNEKIIRKSNSIIPCGCWHVIWVRNAGPFLCTTDIMAWLVPWQRRVICIWNLNGSIPQQSHIICFPSKMGYLRKTFLYEVQLLKARLYLSLILLYPNYFLYHFSVSYLLCQIIGYMTKWWLTFQVPLIIFKYFFFMKTYEFIIGKLQTHYRKL